MLLSALKCDEIGLTFASVHDSFWTHAADIPVMNRVLRDAFVRMHSEDIIGRLRAEFSARYKDGMYLATVLARSPVGRQIQKMRRDKKQKGERQISAQKGYTSELVVEWKRQQLLRSKDPKEREEGKKTITACSIFESANDPSAFAVPTEVESLKLGNVPDPSASEERDVDVEGADEGALDKAYGKADIHSTAAETIPNNEHERDLQAQAQQQAQPAKPKKIQERKIMVWLPLTFPEVPKKGDFDVTRLRDSQYFFS